MYESVDCVWKAKFHPGRQIRGKQGPDLALISKPAILHLLNAGGIVQLRILLSSFVVVALAGCGGSLSRPATGNLVVSPNSVGFGNVGVGQTGTMTVALENVGLAPITINMLSASTPPFTITGQGDLPVQVAVGQTYTATVHFNPTASGDATGQLLATTSLSSTPTVAASLSGTGIPALNALSCASTSVQGPGSDNCSVTLNAAALSGGFVVNLSADNSTLTVPGTVTIPNAATSASFVVSASSVAGPQTASLVASANGVSKQLALNLVPPSSGPHRIQLSWVAPASTDDPVAGYNIFRAPSGSNAFQLLNSQIDPQTTFIDTTAQSGFAYDYYVESVDADGTASSPSNTITLAIP